MISDLDITSGKDDVPAGTVVTSINGHAVAATGDTVVEGTYGTLTVHADGSYSYAVSPTFTGPYGSVDDFEYKVRAPDGETGTAHLDITIDLPGTPEAPIEIDNTVIVTAAPDVHGPAAGEEIAGVSGLSVLNLNALGNIVSASALNGSNVMSFTVDADTVRTLDLHGTFAGVSLAYDLNLLVYKLDPATGEYVQYHQENSWLSGSLLQLADSADSTISFGPGDYKVMVGSADSGNLTVLGAGTLSTASDQIADYSHPGAITGTTIGDVTVDALATDTVTRVDGQDVVAGTATTVAGQYGTLTINADGTYSYSINPPSTPGWTPPYGKIDTFSYTLETAAGEVHISTLKIEIDLAAAHDLTGSTQVVMANETDPVSAGTGSQTVSSSTAQVITKSFTIDAGAHADDLTLVLHRTDGLLTTNGGTLDYRVADSLGNTVLTASGVTAGDLTVHLPSLSAGTYTLTATGHAATGPLGAITGSTWSETISGTEVHPDAFVPTGTTVGGTGSLFNASTEAVASITMDDQTLYTNGNSPAAATLVEQGHYGTLTVHTDGSYTYVADGTGYGVDHFEFTLHSVIGTSSHANLDINVGETFTGSAYGDSLVSTGGNDTFTLGAGADVVAYHDLPGGNGHDTWTDFNASQGDEIDLSDLLTSVSADQSNLSDYVQVHQDGTDTVVAVDKTGTGHFADLVTLSDVNMSLNDLKDHLVTSHQI